MLVNEIVVAALGVAVAISVIPPLAAVDHCGAVAPELTVNT
jgi:hypothetical protein